MATRPRCAETVATRLGATAASSVRQLVVEGPEDDDIYRVWLRKLAPAGVVFTTKVDLVAVHSKRDVLSALEWFRDNERDPQQVYGLVDRDEWDAATVAHWQSNLPRLLVNQDRHSLESYFCWPEDIKKALAAEDVPNFDRQFPELNAQVHKCLPDWIDHWALMVTAERLKTRLVDAEYPNRFHNTHPIPTDAEIRQAFHDWAAILDADAAFGEFDQARQLARAKPPAEQARSCVWAKGFFPQCVQTGAAGFNSMKSKEKRDWMVDLAENMPAVPADIAAILNPLLA